MKVRAMLTAVLSLALIGCGTVNTVIRGDAVASRNLKRSYCKSIPRVYSGVSYDFCTLHGPPAPVHDTGAAYFFFDFVPSAVFDTVALPYTIYRQNRDGNIQIR